MQSFLNLGKRFLADEKAAEVTELGIVLALIVALAIASISTIGGVVKNAYATAAAAL